MLQNKMFEHGSFAAKSMAVSSLATDHGIEELNSLSGWEVMSIINLPAYGGTVLFLQSGDVRWEYAYHADVRNVGMKGFVSHDHRRESICGDLEGKVKDGWRIVSVIEGSSGILIFVFKRPVQEQATADDS